MSNIKDLVLTIISIKYFKDIQLTTVSESGIVFCLSASLIFSVTLIDGEEGKGDGMRDGIEGEEEDRLIED